MKRLKKLSTYFRFYSFKYTIFLIFKYFSTQKPAKMGEKCAKAEQMLALADGMNMELLHRSVIQAKITKQSCAIEKQMKNEQRKNFKNYSITFPLLQFSYT